MPVIDERDDIQYIEQIDDKKLYTITQIMQITGVSERSIFRHIADKTLKSSKIAYKGKRVTSGKDLKAWINYE